MSSALKADTCVSMAVAGSRACPLPAAPGSLQTHLCSTDPPAAHQCTCYRSECKVDFWFYTHCQDGLSLSRVKGGRAGAVNPGAPPMTGLLELCVTSPWGADRASRPPGRASFLRSPCASDGVSVKVLGPVGTWFPGKALGGPWAEEAAVASLGPGLS